MVEERTESLRNGLFLALIKPHKSVTSCTVAQWLKALLQAAGVDTSIFSAHSVYGCLLLKLQTWAFTTNDILKAVNEAAVARN